MNVTTFFFKFIFGHIGSSLLLVGPLQLRQVGATLHRGARAPHCSVFSCCRARALGAWASVVVAHGLQSAVSVAVAHGPSCSAACGILPDRGSNPCPLPWQVDSQPLRHQGSPLSCPQWQHNGCFAFLTNFHSQNLIHSVRPILILLFYGVRVPGTGTERSGYRGLTGDGSWGQHL